MNHFVHKNISRKYARAYMQIFGESVSEEVVSNMLNFGLFLKSRPAALFYLKISSVPSDYKLQLLTQVAKTFKIYTVLSPLLTLLSNDRRLELLPFVLDEIVKLYKLYNNIVDITVSSAVPLVKNEMQELERFLELSTGKNVKCFYQVNPSLIAGIRIISDTFLWEHSVAQQLKKIAQNTQIAATKL